MDHNFRQKTQQCKSSFKQKAFYCLLMTMALFSTIQAQLQELKGTVNVNQHQTTALKIIETLDDQSSYSFTYAQEKLSAVPIADFKAEGVSLGTALQLLQKNHGLQFAVKDGNISVKPGKQENTSKPQVLPKKGPGKVTGKIIDEENGQPIVGANIRIGDKGVTTDIDGSFSMTLPKGEYTAAVSYVGYGSKEVNEIEIKDDQTFELNITLKREKGSLSAVVVKASARKESVASLYTRQKNAAGISDGISAEQISRTPDKNIAETLKRISGLTNLDNKYVVVRGLSERYNQAMMNGQMMPSTELNRKNFSYDIIPSNLVDNVIVSKTITPDQSAEFGGGLVQINTKDIPSENFLSLTIGSSYNDKTTGKDFRSPKIDKKQYTGGIPDSRNLFGTLDWKSRSDILNSGNLLPETSDGSPFKDAASVPNSWALYNYKPLPSFNGQLSYGHVMSLQKERTLGFTASASYRNTWQTQDIRMSRDGYWPTDVLKEKVGFTGKRYGFATNVGGLAGIGYRAKTSKISLQTIYLNTIDQQFVLGTGIQQDRGATAGYYDLFTATKLWQSQVKSEHALGKRGTKFNLALSYTLLDRLKPDNKTANLEYLGKGEDSPDNPQSDFSVLSATSSGVSAGALRWWSRALEKNLAWNADFSLPFKFDIGKTAVSNVLKAGYAGWRKDRLFWVFITGSKYFTNGSAEPLSEVFDPAGGGEIYSPRFGDDFHKKPELHAGYMMMDNKIGNKLRLVWGARAEYYNLNGFNSLLEKFIETQQQNNNDLTDYSDLFNREPNWNLFPSANITYSLTPKMNLRLAYSKSIIRPDIREISFFREYDFELGGSYWSQSPIISTKIHHYDFRYEWYPAAGEVLSVSLFYKKLLYPMEIFAMPNRLFELRNDKDAINKGIEIEARKSFAFTGVPVLKNITLYGNFTRLFATVRPMELQYNGIDENNPYKLFVVEKVGAEEKRPQSGASNFMYNAGLYYDHKLFSLSSSFNFITNRFYRVGDANTGSLYEQPMKSLDAQLACKLFKNKGSVRFSVNNLLNSKYIIYVNIFEGGAPYPLDGRQPTTKELKYQQGDVIDYEAAPGRTYSLSFSYSF